MINTFIEFKDLNAQSLIRSNFSFQSDIPNLITKPQSTTTSSPFYYSVIFIPSSSGHLNITQQIPVC
jgi:hypothetical protein